MKKLIFALIAGATAMAAAQAQTITQPKGYVGVGVASAKHESNDDYKASGKIFGGVKVNEMWGVEAGYTDFRRSRSGYTLNNVPGTQESKGHAIYLAGKATAPINEKVAVFGKLGATRTKSEVNATDAVFNRSENKTGVYAGVGLEYKINEQVALSAEYERYGKSRDFGPKPDVWTVAAKYSF